MNKRLTPDIIKRVTVAVIKALGPDPSLDKSVCGLDVRDELFNMLLPDSVYEEESENKQPR